MWSEILFSNVSTFPTFYVTERGIDAFKMHVANQAFPFCTRNCSNYKITEACGNFMWHWLGNCQAFEQRYLYATDTADTTVWHRSMIQWQRDLSFFFRFLDFRPGNILQAQIHRVVSDSPLWADCRLRSLLSVLFSETDFQKSKWISWSRCPWLSLLVLF